ncbi:MAG: hypothetical protein PF693_09270 [Spirochaetia bacterium]|jgi:hypothetical protein|nr:hypothetical protein [Spirochaetia bacterium]
MLKKTLFVIALSCIAFLNIYSDDVNQKGNIENIFIIRTVIYNIEGKTREIVLSHYLDIKSGESFVSESELLLFLEDKLQMINNQRSIAESEIITTYSRDSQNPGRNFVDLEVNLRDTWNYILLPYAKYDSNEGTSISLKGRNYNFLGSMETLDLNLDYLLTNDLESEYSFNGGFELPFYLWGLNWKFGFDEDVTISPDNPLKVTNKAGISIDIPLDSLTWQASIDQEYYLNEDGEIDADGYYLRNAARFGSSIPSRLYLPLFGEITYSPGIITSYAYKPFGSLSPDRKGYELGAQHGIAAGRINWFGNFRDGASLSFDQDFRYNFTTDRWLSDFDAEFQFHKAFGWGGFSSRIKGFYLYNGTESDTTEIGEPIRGILNDRLDGDSAVFVNLDFPVKIWIWFLDRWFEGHISPFLDYALVRPENGEFSLNDGWYSGGIEGFAFLKSARSLYLRMSLGVDLEAILNGALPGDPAPRDDASIYALFIGLGHHY